MDIDQTALRDVRIDAFMAQSRNDFVLSSYLRWIEQKWDEFDRCGVWTDTPRRGWQAQNAFDNWLTAQTAI